MQLGIRGAASALLISCGIEGGGVTVLQPAAPDAKSIASSDGEVPELDAGGLDAGGLDAGGLDAGVDDSPSAMTGGQESGGQPAGSTLVALGSAWRVSSTAALDWTQPDFDDTSWRDATAPLGRGYDVATPWQEPGTVYLRHEFDANLSASDALELRVRRDDGAVAYIDGTQVGRWNVAGTTRGDGTQVVEEVEGSEGYVYFLAAPRVVGEGRHVLAVEVHQGADPDLVFDARLRRLGAASPQPDVLIQVRTRSYNGKYAPDNIGAIWIEDAAGAFVRTLSVWAGVRREHLLQWNSASNANTTDAVTAATSASHRSRVVQWDLRDATGTVVVDGDYVARFEISEVNANDGAGAGPSLSIPFNTTSRGKEFTAGGTEFPDAVVVTPYP
ncbi:MAG: DUF2271 domain-containing protein [Nannocystaceae bacterium]|nr:DUF2271 domain-containing protein [Nannocystaceae bacterium]